jgi:hypothetical protein
VLRFRHIVQWLKIGPIAAISCKQGLQGPNNLPEAAALFLQNGAVCPPQLVQRKRPPRRTAFVVDR